MDLTSMIKWEYIWKLDINSNKFFQYFKKYKIVSNYITVFGY